MKIITHQKIDEALCGTALSIEKGKSCVEFTTTENMAVDETGLVHGGFIFGLADYAAMIAVNHPNVVLGAANVKFLKPVKTSETIKAYAEVSSEKGKKRMVDVILKKDDAPVFEGEFTCFVLEKHVLK